MNETASPLDLAPEGEERKPSPAPFHAAWLLRTLEKMQAGCLHLTLPDGSVRHFGTPAAEVKATLQVRRWDFFRRCLLYGDIGFAESYVEGDWETDSIERVIAWTILNLETNPVASGTKVRELAVNLLKFANRLRHHWRRNSEANSRRNIAAHYDLGNDFYRLWLDRTMTYSSGLFLSPEQSLEEAQHEKYDRLCRELRLRPTDHVLEIGCGWGGFSAHAAKHYGCRLTAVTISPAQYAYALERMRQEGLDGQVEVRLCDYRHLRGQYDKIVSIEMMEALGDGFLGLFCRQLHRLLKPPGSVALQFITVPDARHAELRRGVDFIQKHIFPGSLLLSVGRVNEAINESGNLFLHDLKDLGSSYARTLRCWWQLFNARLGEVHELGFDSRFVRKWNYYLQYCEAAFHMRNISVVQAIYTQPNNPALR